MSNALLPCPFCGSAPCGAGTIGGHQFDKYVGCNGCDYGFQSEDREELAFHSDTVSLWQHRQPYLPPEDVETLLAVLAVLPDHRGGASLAAAQLRAIIEKVSK